MHGSGWFPYMRSGDEKPKVTRELLLRVLAYARGYWWHIAGMLVTILLTTGLSLLTPLIFRNMIDVVIPAKDINRLVMLGLACCSSPREGGDQRHPAPAERHRRRRRDLRSAFGALRAPAAHVPALLHQHQGRRVDVPPQQRRGRRAERHQQHHRQHRHQHDRNDRPAGGHAHPRVAADHRQRAHPAAVHPRRPKARQRPARHRPPGHGHERADERPHERDPQHRRRAAGQALRALR